MGAINLASGNIITLGYKDDYYISDEELREWATIEFEEREHLADWYTLEGYITLKAEEDYYDNVNFWTEEIYNIIQKKLDNFDSISEIINICITPGYYSGFSVTVDIDEWSYFEDWEKKE